MNTAKSCPRCGRLLTVEYPAKGDTLYKKGLPEEYVTLVNQGVAAFLYCDSCNHRRVRPCGFLLFENGATFAYVKDDMWMMHKPLRGDMRMY